MDEFIWQPFAYTENQLITGRVSRISFVVIARLVPTKFLLAILSNSPNLMIRRFLCALRSFIVNVIIDANSLLH